MNGNIVFKWTVCKSALILLKGEQVLSILSTVSNVNKCEQTITQQMNQKKQPYFADVIFINQNPNFCLP